MATYTSNINLKKPAGGDKIRIADINGNMDNIDAAVGAGFGQGTAPSINQAINSLADGLAIIANGNVHAAISAGQFVYVRNHGSLTEGLYTADSNISANGTLSSSNLTANAGGGLNALNSKSTPVYRKASQSITFSNGIANVTFSSGVNLLAVNAVGAGATTDIYCIAGWTRTSGQTNYCIFLKTNASTSMNCDFIFTTDVLSTDITIT